ncbi:unnamed protein product [Plutella xylostella]|uniref:(diamondback moth) hypothetical protein n=1 Tax=Plutella xylostella TaxID=51655 RepID=A0A8S4FZ29_PLUXY|nr:unnamed protein product [Plutella xylostella]
MFNKLYRITFSKFRSGSFSPTPVTTSTNNGENNDLLQKLIGSFGKYQFWVFILLTVVKLCSAFHLFAIIFIAPKVTFICLPNNSTNCPCENPQYIDSVFTNTIVKQWDLICERKWMIGFTQFMFQFGNLVGSLLFGAVSDRFGRRLPLIVACIIQVMTSYASVYITNFWWFTAMRFLLGMTVAGGLVLSFVILMELTGSEYREVTSTLTHSFFLVGEMLLPMIGYFVRDYQTFLLILSIITSSLVIYIFLLPESPRWLFAVNKPEECVKLVKRIAKVNKLPSENIDSQIEEYHKQHTDTGKKSSMMDLFGTPNIRKNAIVMSLMWTSCSYCFYGLAQFTGSLSGDIFINVAINACVTYIGGFLSIPMLKWFRRRPTYMVLNFTCSLCLFVLATCRGTTFAVVLATLGTVCSYNAFVLVYMQTNEIFPTVVRSAALGFGSMMARVGSMIAPFIVLLEDFNPWLSPVLFAIPPLVTGIMCLMLPETKGIELLTTLEQGENLGKIDDKT